MPPSHLPEHRIGIFVRFASSISAAAPETAARKWMPQRWDCGTEVAELRWRLWADAAAKGAPSGRCGEPAIGRTQSTSIGKPQGTIGKPHGTIGKQENSYAVRRMSRPLMPM